MRSFIAAAYESELSKTVRALRRVQQHASDASMEPELEELVDIEVRLRSLMTDSIQGRFRSRSHVSSNRAPAPPVS